MYFSHASLKIWCLAMFPWSHCEQRLSLRMWQASGLPHLPPTTGRACSLCPTPTQTLRLCTDTNKQGKKPFQLEKKNSNLQTVTAELCFSENYHKLIHQYLALRTKNRECPTFFLFATKQAGCHYCLSFRNRQTLPLPFSPKPRGRGMGQIPHWATSLVQWVLGRMNKDHKS